MTTSEFSSLAEAKAHLSELVARVGSQHDRVVVTVHGRPVAVLIAIEDLEAMEETIAVLSDASAMRALRLGPTLRDVPTSPLGDGRVQAHGHLRYGPTFGVPTSRALAMVATLQVASRSKGARHRSR
jgi:prevent-host-death family protein